MKFPLLITSVLLSLASLPSGIDTEQFNRERKTVLAFLVGVAGIVPKF